ncbi:hypothetical protein [Henriciella sp.]|nr:hypothetical protein [Henriciella sp.]
MIAILVALRDFFVAVLVSWLGVSTDAPENQQQAEPAKPATASVAMIG